MGCQAFDWLNAWKQGVFDLKLKNGKTKDAYKFQITEQDANFKNKMHENRILKQLSLPSDSHVSKTVLIL